MLRKRHFSVIWIGILLALFAVGCKKKVPPPPPPPAPPKEAPKEAPPRPTIVQFSAEPSSIERGQSATLRWSVQNATNISINQGIGTVQANGEQRVQPNDSTTYTLTATGAGGEATATATVNVTAPPPPPPPAAPPKPSLSERLSAMQDCYFDFDKNDIRADCREVLTKDADTLKGILTDFPDATIMLEGNCDERGSAEYNLALGDRRSTAVKEFLVQLGVSGDKLKTISYGKERPVCTDKNDDCYQKNRHVHFAPGQ